MLLRSILVRLVLSIVGVTGFQFCFGRSCSFEDSFISFYHSPLALLLRMVEGLSSQIFLVA
jgi:hypothetical protein